MSGARVVQTVAPQWGAAPRAPSLAQIPQPRAWRLRNLDETRRRGPEPVAPVAPEFARPSTSPEHISHLAPDFGALPGALSGCPVELGPEFVRKGIGARWGADPRATAATDAEPLGSGQPLRLERNVESSVRLEGSTTSPEFFAAL